MLRKDEEKKLQVIHIKNTTNNSIKKVGRTLYISFIHTFTHINGSPSYANTCV